MTRPAGARRLPLPFEPSSRLKLQWLSFGLVATALLAVPALGFAQGPKPANPASAPAGAKPAGAPAKVAPSKPTWAELSPMQQQALAPLAASWNTTIAPRMK